VQQTGDPARRLITDRPPLIERIRNPALDTLLNAKLLKDRFIMFMVVFTSSR
jgi:hypothetical protein